MHPFALVLPLLLQTPAPDAGAADSPAVSAGRAAVAPFKQALKSALLEALKTSPEAAIDVCSEQAPQLARTHSHDGVKVGRSALKLRNEKNAPPAWLKPVLEELSKAPAGADVTKVVTLPDGRVGYAEPIWTQPPCLVCHGTQVPESVKKQLDAKYPHDAARGFELGAFRGVFWAELPRPKS